MVNMRATTAAILVLVINLGLCQGQGNPLVDAMVNGKVVDIRPGFLRPRCGDACILKNVMATSALDCGTKCALTDGCKCAIYRVTDGYCSLKNVRLFAPEMNTIEDADQMHVGIRMLNPDVLSPPVDPSPSPTPSPDPSPSPSPSPEPSPSPVGGTGGTGLCDDPEIKAAVNYQNDVRAQNGAAPLKCDEKLSQVALAWSQDMCSKDVLDHGDFSGRVVAAGFTGAMAENIAYLYWSNAGHGTEVAKMWEGSEGHFLNMINPTYSLIGLGYVKCGGNKIYWTENFTSPQ